MFLAIGSGVIGTYSLCCPSLVIGPNGLLYGVLDGRRDVLGPVTVRCFKPKNKQFQDTNKKCPGFSKTQFTPNSARNNKERKTHTGEYS